MRSPLPRWRSPSRFRPRANPTASTRLLGHPMSPFTASGQRPVRLATSGRPGAAAFTSGSRNAYAVMVIDQRPIPAASTSSISSGRLKQRKLASAASISIGLQVQWHHFMVRRPNNGNARRSRRKRKSSEAASPRRVTRATSREIAHTGMLPALTRPTIQSQARRRA